MDTHKPLSKDTTGTDVDVRVYSDYVGAILNRKSTTGGCQFLEYIAASNCCGQVLWLQNQLLAYGYNFMQTKIHVDNKSAICVVKNPVYHSKTKHIEIRHHFIRDSYEKRLIEMVKIHTDYNVADLLTKAFDVTRMGCKSGQVMKIGLELQGYLINDGYADLVQLAGYYFNTAGVFLLGFHQHNKWSSIHHV
nr:putative ribonuclease H-like domain-containing protein [Tanacetum cinerariifolium]